MAANKRHQRAVSALGQAYQSTDRTLRKLRGRDNHLPDGEIGFSRFELMDVLRETQPTSAGDLAVAAGFTAASISRMLDALVTAGFVDRIRSESDRRVVMVTLTYRPDVHWRREHICMASMISVMFHPRILFIMNNCLI